MNELVQAMQAEEARLPEVYRQACTALAQCVEIDECKDWADKADALKSYAKQAGDPRLFSYAARIKARAVDMAGALLKEFDARGGDRTGKSGDAPTSVSQRQAAADAGMSKDQQVQAVRVNNVPREQFEEMVESDKPPTITELAEIGKRTLLTSEKPPEFALATRVIGSARLFANECDAHSPDAVLRGLLGGERPRAGALMRAIHNWTGDFLETMERTS